MKLTIEQQQWVDTLRSGKYKEGRGFLKRVIDGECFHCCLGVAQELFSQEKIRMAKPDDHGCSKSNRTYPTNDVVEALNLIDHQGAITRDKWCKLDYMPSLSTANDRGMSFEELANFIEQNPEAVFTKGAE